MRELIRLLLTDPNAVRKFIVALVGAVAVAVSVGLLPAAVGAWLAVASAFLTAMGVYAVPNKDTDKNE